MWMRTRARPSRPSSTPWPERPPRGPSCSCCPGPSRVRSAAAVEEACAAVRRCFVNNRCLCRRQLTDRPTQRICTSCRQHAAEAGRPVARGRHGGRHVPVATVVHPWHRAVGGHRRHVHAARHPGAARALPAAGRGLLPAAALPLLAVLRVQLLRCSRGMPRFGLPRRPPCAAAHAPPCPPALPCTDRLGRCSPC